MIMFTSFGRRSPHALVTLAGGFGFVKKAP
jgi:hypothetical protein